MNPVNTAISTQRLCTTKWWPHASTPGCSSQPVASRQRANLASALTFSLSPQTSCCSSPQLFPMKTVILLVICLTDFIWTAPNMHSYCCVFVFCPYTVYIVPVQKIKSILQVFAPKIKVSYPNSES